MQGILDAFLDTRVTSAAFNQHRLLLLLLAMSFVLLAGPGIDSVEVNTRIPLHL